MQAISSTYFAVSEMMPSLSTKAKTDAQLIAAKILLIWVQPEE
jgi:hypothetical protein